MSIHNQPQKKHEAYIQARAREATLRAASPVLLMQLWSHSVDAAATATQKRLRNAKEASRLSHTWRSHTLACSQPSRSHPRTPPQEILHLYPHPRLPSSSAAPCFREDGLGQQEQRSTWLSKQVRARYLPKTDRGLSTVFYRAHWELPPVKSSIFRVRSADLETKR